jgi:hypothetical protein
MTRAPTHFSDPAEETRQPAYGTLSRTPFQDERVKAEKQGADRDLAAPGPAGVVNQCLQP